VGSFGLHSGEAGYFDEEEMKVLNELAGNIASRSITSRRRKRSRD